MPGALLLSCCALALAGCGADDVAVPGGPIVINPGPAPAPSPSPSPSPTPGTSVTAAAACTTGTTDAPISIITLQNNRGTIRNCRVPNQVTGTLTLSGRRSDGIMYSISGRTDVGRDIDQANGVAATLNVSPGVTVFAETRETTLVVNRGSRLVADGTAPLPIIFTALSNLTGQALVGGALTDATDNEWGGISINGRAPVSDCDALVSSSNVGGTAGCNRQSEGVTPRPLFGGATANDNSGVLRFVQINFTGVGAGGDEVQGITAGGLGSQTVISNVQIHNSRDDGIELFGGTVNMDHLVMTGIADDSLDTDNGYIGAVQYVLAIRRAQPPGTIGDSLGGQTVLEVDSSAANDATPRQKLKLANFTFVQNTANEPAIRLRGGADATLLNGIVVARSGGSQGCFDVDDAQTVQTAGPDESGPPVLRSVVFDCQTLIDADADTFEETALSTAGNDVRRTFTNSLVLLTGSTVGMVAPGAGELGVTAAANITAVSSFFMQVSYIGAFSGPGDTWTQGWTCNSDLVNLRGATSCTDIRIS